MAQKSNFIVRGGLDCSNITKGLATTQKSIITFQSGVSKAVKGITAVLGTLAIGSYLKDSLTAASTLQSTLTGLTSILEGQGKSVSGATAFLQSYVKDGLIPMTNAAQAYKNLAVRGYNDEQIKKTLTNLKNSSSFGRQAALTMGEAVQSATEGLKNENSILVDNAGVTKNVSKMWEDYAKSIGTTVDKLTKEQRIQAEVNGIIEETKWQMGDAAKYSSTYAGRLAALNKTLLDIKINIGNAIMPIANKVLPVLQSLSNKIASVTATFANFMSTVFGKVISGTVTTATDSTDNLVDSTNAVGDAAEASGKKISNSLGIDEINQVSSSSGGSGSGTSTTTSTEANTDVTDSGTEANTGYSASFDKLLSSIAPFTTALGKLSDTLKIIGSYSFDALKDFYEGFLKPLGKWAFGTEGKGISRLVDVINNDLLNIDWKSINKNLKEFWVAIEPYAENFGEGLIDFFEDIGDLSVFGINKLLGKDSAFSNLVTSLKNGNPEAARKWGYALGTFATSLLLFKSGSAAAVALQNITGLIALGTVATTITVGVLFTKDFIQWQEYIKKYGWEDGREKYGDLIKDSSNDPMKKNAEAGADYFANVWNNAIQKVKNSFEQFYSTRRDPVRENAVISTEYFSNLWKNATEKASKSFEQFKINLDISLEQAKTSMSSWWNDTWASGAIMNMEQWFADHVSPWFTTEKWTALFSNINTSFSTKWQELSEWWNLNALTTWWNTGVMPWFSIEKWNTVLGNIKISFATKWNEISNWWKSSALSKWWTQDVAPWFTFDKWTSEMAQIPNAFKEVFKNSANAAIDIFNSLFDWLNEKLNISWDALYVMGKQLYPAGSYQLFTIPHIPKFKYGGFVEEDGLFQANSDELIGKFSNGKTAVANNDMIVSGITGGVEKANALQNQLLKEQNSLLKQLVEKSGVYIGDREIAKAAARGQKSLGYLFT